MGPLPIRRFTLFIRQKSQLAPGEECVCGGGGGGGGGGEAGHSLYKHG